MPALCFLNRNIRHSYNTTLGQSSLAVIRSVKNIQSEDQIQSSTQPFSAYKEYEVQRQPKKEWMKLQGSTEFPQPALYAEIMTALWSELQRNGVKDGESARHWQAEIKWREAVIKKDLFSLGDELLCSTTDPEQRRELVYRIYPKKGDRHPVKGVKIQETSSEFSNTDNFSHSTERLPFHMGIKMRPSRERQPHIWTPSRNSTSQPKSLKYNSPRCLI